MPPQVGLGGDVERQQIGAGGRGANEPDRLAGSRIAFRRVRTLRTFAAGKRRASASGAPGRRPARATMRQAIPVVRTPESASSKIAELHLPFRHVAA
jgi:hypothetical protein